MNTRTLNDTLQLLGWASQGYRPDFVSIETWEEGRREAEIILRIIQSRTNIKNEHWVAEQVQMALMLLGSRATEKEPTLHDQEEWKDYLQYSMGGDVDVAEMTRLMADEEHLQVVATNVMRHLWRTSGKEPRITINEIITGAHQEVVGEIASLVVEKVFDLHEVNRQLLPAKAGSLCSLLHP